MKDNKILKRKFSIVTLIISTIVFGCILLFVGISIGGAHRFDDNETSPSGDYTLEYLFGHDIFAEYIKLNIVSNIGKKGTSIILDKKYYTHFRITTGWGADDALWVYSGDTGFYSWELIVGEWEEVDVSFSDYNNAPLNIKEELEKQH